MAETRRAMHDGVGIAYEVREEAGPQAPWAVLVHGLGYPRAGWGPFADALAETANLVLVDNRGIGESDVPPGPYDAATMAGDVVAVLDDAGLERAHLVGTSLGGMIAMEVALGWPARVDRLVLLAASPGGERAVPMPAATADLLARAQRMDAREALRALIANALSAGARARDPDLVDRIAAIRTATAQDPDGWQAQAAAGTTYDSGGREAGIAAPTLVVHGAEDVVLDPRNARLLAEQIPAATLVELDGTGHLLFWEQPRTVTRLVGHFLVGQDPRGDGVHAVRATREGGDETMTDPVERTVRTDRLAIRTWERGDGDAILFVHGNLSSGAVWYEQLQFLPAGYRGIAPDLRGYGSTEPAPIDGTRGTRDWSDDLAALLEAEDIRACHVVGHSMGGGVAMQLALDHPDRIRSLTLVSSMSPYGFGGTRADGTPCAADYAGSGGGVANPELVRRMDEGDRSEESEASPRRVVRDLFFPSPEVVRDEDAIVEAMLAGRVGEDFYPGDSTESPNWPYVAPGERGVLNAISPRYCDLSAFATDGPAVPVMWMHGAEDRIIADGSLADLGTLGQLGAVPGWPGEDTFPPQPMVSQLRDVLAAHPGPLSTVWREGVGHFPFVQEPERFAETLARHLEEVRP